MVTEYIGNTKDACPDGRKDMKATLLARTACTHAYVVVAQQER